MTRTPPPLPPPPPPPQPASRKSKRRRRLPLETEISWFLLVCALDVVFTHIALHLTSIGATQLNFVESNPLARWVIQNWGLRGMVVFKASSSLLVVAIALAIRPVRPLVSRLLLLGGTLVVGVVVVYSVRLLILHR
ncbi:MAG: DUF5658 family protein [Planctomycetaceae bacterium]